MVGVSQRTNHQLAPHSSPALLGLLDERSETGVSGLGCSVPTTQEGPVGAPGGVQHCEGGRRAASCDLSERVEQRYSGSVVGSHQPVTACYMSD